MVTVKNVRPHAVVIGSVGFVLEPDEVADVDGSDAGVRAMLAAGVLVVYTRPVPAVPSAPPPDVAATQEALAQQVRQAQQTAAQALDAAKVAASGLSARMTSLEEVLEDTRRAQGAEREAHSEALAGALAQVDGVREAAQAALQAYRKEADGRLSALESRPMQDASARSAARAADGKAQDALNQVQQAARAVQSASEAARSAQQTAQGAADAAGRAQSLAQNAVTPAQLEEAVAALAQQVRGSRNLVNHAASRVGRLASNTDGAERALAGYVLTDFVGVAAGARYALTVYPKAVSGGFVVWYRTDRAFLSGQTLPPNTEHAALTAPAGAAWVRISAAVGGNQAAFALFQVS